jgi:DME family drug/metabolite transporter
VPPVVLSGEALARVQIMLGALLFSTGGAAIKLSTLTGWQVSALRCGFAALVMWLFLPKARLGWSWRTLLVGVPYATTFVLYALANKATTAASAIFLQDTAPLYLLLLGPLLLAERVRKADLGFMLALAVGSWLIFSGASRPLATAPDPRLGDLLAAASGISWALTILGLRWIALRAAFTGEQPAAAVVGGSLIAFSASAPFAFPLHAPGATDLAIAIYLGAFQIALAYALITEGVRRVSALESSLLLLLEPVFAPLWAWWVLAETASGRAWIGGALIVCASALNTLSRSPSTNLLPRKLPE